MSFRSSPHRLPWQFRLAALAVACVLAFSWLFIWAAGVKFMHLLAKVSGEIVESEQAKAAAMAPPETHTPGVVSVSILPEPETRP